MMKIRLFFLIAFLAIVTLGVKAQIFTYKNLKYIITSPGTVAVTSQEMQASGPTDIPSEVISGDKTYTVTAIADYAFDHCSGLGKVTIPSTVTSIGKSAFRCCISMPACVIPNTVTSIGEGCFLECTTLTEIKIAALITTIEANTFNACRNLRKITLPSTLEHIKEYAFLDCRKMKEIILPNSVKTISNQAFRACADMEHVVLPNSLTTIGENVFLGCINFKTLTIPASVTYFGSEDEFYGVDIYNLSSVNVDFKHCNVYTPALGNIPFVTNNRDTATAATILEGESLNIRYVIPDAEKEYGFVDDSFKTKEIGEHFYVWESKDTNNNVFTMMVKIVSQANSVNNSSLYHFDLYPSIAKKHITLTGVAPGETITIYDLSGKLETSVMAISETMYINIEELALGQYVVMNSKKGNAKFKTRRFIKM